ncbi:inovirus Gp2 family protein [Duganella sp. CY15W]|uniref:inovirus Gp2 family protein n=1 Tax=Duganella sp. CY15W TaxID=2692172 RepID=UPI001928B810|nr:inovirus Gp2 family protein [Duganella sp. CY15W]
MGKNIPGGKGMNQPLEYQMPRHSSNRNLTLHYASTYKGSPIQDQKGPFIKEHLDTLHRTITHATSQYREVFAFRFDLRLPMRSKERLLSYQNELMGLFISSFKAKIKHNRRKALQENPKAHDSVVRFVWAREFGQRGRPHYHCAILLNKDAFCALGRYARGIDNMYNRLHEAWASALARQPDDVMGLVHFPENATYVIHRDDQDSFDEFFFRASYLCKSSTKAYGDGGHGFGASRI